MFRSVALAAVALALATSVPIASALDSKPACCVCAPGGTMAQSSGAFNGTKVPALFCATVNPGGNSTDLADRCHELTGGLLECVASTDDTNSSCRVQLADMGILCPASAAPAAGAASLLSLAVALGALGALLQRRSRHRRGIE